MKGILVLFAYLCCVCSSAQTDLITIKGIVNGLDETIEGILVSVKGTDIKTTTDAAGRYLIKTPKNKTLRFEGMGMQPREIVLEDLSRTLNISLQPKVTMLDEVTVKDRKISTIQKQMQLETNKDLIRTSVGILDKRSSGTSMTMIDGNTIRQTGGFDFLAALAGRVPGMRVNRSPNDPSNPQVTLRGNVSIQNTYPAIYEVDGAVTRTFPNWIDVEMIDRIAVLPSLGATAKYGSIASGGVIIINTKAGVKSFARQGYSAEAKNNIYSPGSVRQYGRGPQPQFLVDLNKAASKKEAFEIYQTALKRRGEMPYFLMEVANYFKDRWNAQDITDSINLKIRTKASKNAEISKALAYAYEKEGSYGKAVDLYRNILKLRPRYGQSYRDLANALNLSGDKKAAANIYLRYIAARGLDQQTFLADDIDSIMVTEMNNLFIGQGNQKQTEVENLGTRILLEWNSGEAEFDLQFVNPDNRYYTWNHTYGTNPDVFRLEKLKGFSSKQFFIDESNLGTWLINIRYYGNKSYEPTYMKMTHFKNYGTPSETKQSYVFKLNQENTWINLLKLVNNPITFRK